MVSILGVYPLILTFYQHFQRDIQVGFFRQAKIEASEDSTFHGVDSSSSLGDHSPALKP